MAAFYQPPVEFLKCHCLQDSTRQSSAPAGTSGCSPNAGGHNVRRACFRTAPQCHGARQTSVSFRCSVRPGHRSVAQPQRLRLETPVELVMSPTGVCVSVYVSVLLVHVCVSTCVLVCVSAGVLLCVSMCVSAC